MRSKLDEQLQALQRNLIQMGGLCEEAIELASKPIIGESKEDNAKEVRIREREIDQLEKDIEDICMKLLLRQQPVAKDLRQISAALKMITDMERIGDQACDIADILPFVAHRGGTESEYIKKMAQETIGMVNQAVDAFVKLDTAMAQEVLDKDDIVDDCFREVKSLLIKMITENHEDGEYALDILMIAKYFERIGDHATNIAEWVQFAITGEHKGE